MKDVDDDVAHGDIEEPLLQQSVIRWKGPLFILCFECLTNIAFMSVSMSLVIYLTKVLHESSSSSATIATAFSGTTFFTPLFGAYVADSFLGSFRTVAFSSLICVLSIMTINLSAFLQFFYPLTAKISLTSPSTLPRMIFYIGLCLAAFGAGGLNSSLLPLGADQFDDENPIDRKRKAVFFTWFFLCIMIGKLVSGTAIVWVQDNIGWAVGYGIATLCVVSGTVCFLVGIPAYKKKIPKNNPLKSILQVLVASLRKINSKVPRDTSLLYEDEVVEELQKKLTHTNRFSFLDKAAVVEDDGELRGSKNNSWRLCTVTQVEELKIFLQMTPIFLTSVVFGVAFSQTNSTTVLQGRAMNTKIGSFSVPPAAMQSFEVLSVFIWTIFYNKIIVTAIRRYGGGNIQGLSLFQRMGIGRFLMILAMALAAFTETERLKNARAGKPISILWQIPLYFIIGGADSLNYVGQIEFFYEQAPDSMKTTGSALHLLTMSIGDYLNTLVVSVLQMITAKAGRKGWIPDNLNEGHLDYFFWFLALLCTLNLAAHIHFSRKYNMKNSM